LARTENPSDVFGKSNIVTAATKNFLAAIIASSDDAIISKDLSGIIRSWNNGARRIFGYEAEEIVGQPILRLIPQELHHEEEAILAKLRAGERIDHFETVRVRKDGEQFPISVTISPIKDDSGTVIGASKIARDISDRKRVERLAIQAEKLATTGRMAAAIAHEINNPLASVLNLIFLARQSDSSREEIQGYLATAESELERVSHIARQALGYYRDTGSPSEVRLEDLAERVLGVYRNKLLALGIVVDAKYNHVRLIKVRSGEIVQVLSNVISNAIDAMPQGGRLMICTTQRSDGEREGIEVFVSDTGHGIRREDLNKVFEPFFTTKGNLGTGIGLWVARELTEGHGGQISISSNTEPSDRGTTVKIYLPFNGSETKINQSNGSQTDTESQ
jgi:PAS domain S-box-containing protein